MHKPASGSLIATVKERVRAPRESFRPRPDAMIRDRCADRQPWVKQPRATLESERLSARIAKALRSMHACVEAHPAKAEGRYVLRGTQFTIAQMFSQMAEGDSVGDLVENFDLDGDDIRCFLNSLAVSFDRPRR